MSASPPALDPVMPQYLKSAHVRYRVERLGDHYAVVDRLSGDVVQGGFTSDRLAWTWLINCIDGRRE
jgi:hypothetical protein